MGKRHQQLFQLIDLFQSKTIVEVGTWSGINAVNMIRVAQKYHKEICYIGYDLFEEATPETDAKEFNVKRAFDVNSVRNLIESNCPDARVNLIKGNTRETLKSVSADFVFIDGGHSIETIEHDYRALKNSGIIVLDDYYTAGDSETWPDITEVGCNMLVESLPSFKILPVKDKLRDGGYNQMVLIT